MYKLKKIIIIIGCIFLLLITQANAQISKQGTYQINGTINGISSGLIKMLSFDTHKVEDSAIIENGKFILRGKTGLPEQRVFQIVPGIWAFQAFVEPGNLIFTIDTVNAQYYGQMGHGGWALIWQIEENGSELADVYNRYKSETKQRYYISMIASLNDSLKAIKNNNSAQEDNILKQIDSIKNIALESQKLWITNYINQNSSSIAGTFLMKDFLKSSTPNILTLSDFESMLNKFSGVAKTSIYYQQLAKTIANLKNRQRGKAAPDFTLLQRDKTKFTLSATRGNYVLLDFWASWCGPCRKAIPHWKEIYKRYHQRKLEIVSIADDRYRNDWLKALDEEQMPWIQVIDSFSANNEPALVGKLYETYSIPYYVLLDKEGKVILASGDEDLITKKINQIVW